MSRPALGRSPARASDGASPSATCADRAFRERREPRLTTTGMKRPVVLQRGCRGASALVHLEPITMLAVHRESRHSSSDGRGCDASISPESNEPAGRRRHRDIGTARARPVRRGREAAGWGAGCTEAGARGDHRATPLQHQWRSRTTRQGRHAKAATLLAVLESRRYWPCSSLDATGRARV